MDIENIQDVQAEIVIEEGWSEDESGLPVFSAGSADIIENELVSLRANEGEQRLKLAAVLTEASDRRFYGENTLKTVAKENQMSYSTARSMVAGYKRLKDLNADDREELVTIIKSGELYWSKVEIGAPVKDDQTYTELMHLSADGSLSNTKLRKRVSSISGQKAIDAPEADEDATDESVEDAEVVEDAEEVPQDLSHPEKLRLFLSGARFQAEELNAEGGFKGLDLEPGQYQEYLEDLEALRKMTRTWSDQIKRELKKGE
jgi:hypothetical protein